MQHLAATSACHSHKLVVNTSRQSRMAAFRPRGVAAAKRVGIVRATAQPDPDNDGWSATMSNARRSVDNVLQRYDFVSAGLGALAVTTYCVARGQDAATALWITAASTVVALVVNDNFFKDS